MKTLRPIAAAFLALLTIGCGTQNNALSACSAGRLASTTSGEANFSLVPINPDLTIYPGQTEQVAVTIQPIGAATGIVQIAPGQLPDGLTVTPTSGAIGSTVNLTFTAAPDVAAECFTGLPNIFTAARAVTLTGNTATGFVSQQIALNIVMENPAAVPATTNLPVMRIVTTGAVPVTSEDDYVTATLSITDPTTKANNYTGAMGIKGHGHSTWDEPKKPYRLNLNSKAPLLGMTSDSNWILLANFDDKTMLRNDVSFNISKMFGMFWTPSTAFVELYLNNVYEGTYQLAEKVEVSKARLNIGSIDDTDNSGTDLTGGYLGEIDNYQDEGDTFISAAGLPIGLADPDPPTATQADYFHTAFTAAEAALYAPNFADPNTGWRASWDQASLVNYFLVEELAGNEDADDWSSDYFYKPRSDTRFYRGPVWDMDVSLGNANYGAIQSPDVSWVGSHSKWYSQLLQDPTFLQAVKDRWATMRPQVGTLPAYIDTRASAMSLTATNNFQRWPILGEHLWPSPETAGSYQGEINYLKTWLTQRIAYMDAHYLQP